jgi:5-methylthioadenosine/S-adenosylhomocysteine deaminase
MTVLIKNGYCLGKGLDDFFDILIENDKIKSIKKEINVHADTVIDAENSIVFTSFCNAHTHLAMSLFRGMADDLALMDWLNNHIFPNEARYVTKEMVYACSKLSILELIRSGSGCFMDMYFFEEEVAKAALELGIKGVIGEGIVDFSTPSCISVDDAISKTIALKKEFESDTIKVSFAPHSTYTLSRDNLKKIANVYDGSIIQTHANESDAEVDMVLKDKLKRPIEVLDEFGILSEKTYLAHCVSSSQSDMEIIKERGSNVINVPKSNLKLASGIAPIYKMMNMGIDIFLGTDGSASNNKLDMIEEARTMSLVQKITSGDETALGAKESFNIAVNSIFSNSGKLEEGYSADISIIKLDSIESTPIFNPYSYIIYAANSRDVSTVIINGRIILKDREFVNIDEEKIKYDVKHMAKELGALF